MKKVHNCPLARLPCLRKRGRLAKRPFPPFSTSPPPSLSRFLGPLSPVRGRKTQTSAWYLFEKWWSATDLERKLPRARNAKIICLKIAKTRWIPWVITLDVISRLHMCVCRSVLSILHGILEAFWILQRFGNTFVSAEFDRTTLLRRWHSLGN